MPGNTGCVRCGTSLRLSELALAVQPPRASARAKRLRNWIPTLRYFYLVRDSLQQFSARWTPSIQRFIMVARLPAGAWPRLIVPGWAHWYLGEGRRGFLFLLGWLTLAGLTLLTFGSALSAMFAGFMVAVHAGAATDLMWRSREFESGAAAVTAVVCWTVSACIVALALYTPVRWAITQWVDARQWIADAPPLQEGDVLLFRPSSSAPKPGDVVLYFSDGLNHQDNQHRVLQRPVSEQVDRVIAVAGSRVRWSQGTLTVDGQPAPYRPLNPDRLPLKLELRVPDGCLCIFPTTDEFSADFTMAGIWEQRSIVQEGAVLGRVLVRNYPWYRFWWVR
jgi:hypothetical protein